MPVWELVGFSTDYREHGDVRHREYTTSKKRAERFSEIPRIQFTDCGHGIEFVATPHSGRRKPTRYMDYVREQMAKPAPSKGDNNA